MIQSRSLLPSTLSRLGRESEMLDTIVTMMGDERLDGHTAHGTPRRVLIDRLATNGFELANAVWVASGREPIQAPELGLHQVASKFRLSHHAFVEAAIGLDDLDADVEYAAMTLRPAEVVPQRIAEVVLANGAVSSLWSLDEADPDSVRDSLDALVRRLEFTEGCPGLSLATIEGDEWLVRGGGHRVRATREALAAWLANGDNEIGEDLPEIPALMGRREAFA